MTLRCFIVHGWDGSPQEGWYPWLKKELTKKHLNIQVLKMPNSSQPKISQWVSFLKKRVGTPTEETFLVGHSIGCQTILRYLALLPKHVHIGGVILIAPWVHLKNLETEEEKKIAKPWLKTPLQWKKILVHTNTNIAIFSDNDPYVPQTDARVFKKRLNAKIILVHKKGHFSGGDKVTKLPPVYDELRRVAKF